MASKKFKKNKFIEPTTNVLYLIPFILTIIVVPLIIRYRKFENHLSEEVWHSASTTSSDIFLLWKSYFFIGFSVLLLLFLITSFIMESKKFIFEKEYIPLAVYFVFVLLSTFASKDIYFSLHGIENHFESVWVLSGYVLMVFYGSIMVDNTKAVRIFIYGWLFGTWILMLLGVFQAFKLDFFLSDWIKPFLLPADMQTSKMKLNFDLGQVYITLYNPNYVGYFAAVTIPVFLTLAFFAKEYWKKALFAVTVIGVFICSVASAAKNGLIAIIVSFIFLIIMFRREILRKWKIIAILIASCIVVFVGIFFGINSLRDNSMIESLKYAFNTMISKDTTERHVDSITCNDDSVCVSYDGKKFYLSMDVNDEGNVAILFKDEDGKEIPTTINSNYFMSASEEFPATAMSFNLGLTASQDTRQIIAIDLIIDGYDYILSNQLGQYGYDNSYYYRNACWKWVKIQEAETVLFTDKPKLFSNRGYIWSRTIPLLKDNLIVGSGPDTFAFQYPHTDYVNSAYVGFLNQIVTKPHNLYLQIGVQTGVISMLAFITFFMIYFVRSILLYWKHPLDTIISKIGIGLAASTLGYMISGIINDSTITYAPVFWGVIGVGIGLNRLVRNEFKSRPETEASVQK